MVKIVWASADVRMVLNVAVSMVHVPALQVGTVPRAILLACLGHMDPAVRKHADVTTMPLVHVSMAVVHVNQGGQEGFVKHHVLGASMGGTVQIVVYVRIVGLVHLWTEHVLA